MAEGDRLVLISDGIVEAADAEGRLFGFERVHKMLRSGGKRRRACRRGAELWAAGRYQRDLRNPGRRALPCSSMNESGDMITAPPAPPPEWRKQPGVLGNAHHGEHLGEVRRKPEGIDLLARVRCFDQHLNHQRDAARVDVIHLGKVQQNQLGRIPWAAPGRCPAPRPSRCWRYPPRSAGQLPDVRPGM
jgi:hypothetical protein